MSAFRGTPAVSPTLSERLQDVTEALAAATTEAAVFGTVLTAALGALGAVAGAVLLLNAAGDHLEMAATRGHEQQVHTIWQGGTLDDASPAGDALHRHEPLFFEHQGALVTAYPHLEARTGALASVASAVLPMFLAAQPLGVIVLDFREPHDFGVDEQRFLRTLAAQCALALGRTRLIRDFERRVAERSRDAEVLAALGDALQGASSPEQVAELALGTIGPALRAQSMLVVRRSGQEIRLPTLWGDTPPAITEFMTRPGLTLDETPLLSRVAQTGQGVYLRDYRAEPGTIAAFPALASGVEPIRTPDGRLEGFLVAWRPTALGDWPPAERTLLRRAAGTIGLALERAERGHQLEEERAALDAFVAYKEAVGAEHDVLALARLAVQVVHANLEHVSAAYYELDRGLWRARAWSDDVPELVAAQIAAGLPTDAPNVSQAVRTREAVFADGWDAGAEGVPGASDYGAAAFIPLVVQDQVKGLFAVGASEARAWTERERRLTRAVARGLSITLERTEAARQLEMERAALEAFTRFTEAVGTDTDLPGLIRRAEGVLRTVFEDASVAYHELEGGLWKLRLWSDDVDPALAAMLAEGLPEDTPAFQQAVQQRAAHFIDDWHPERGGVAGSGGYQTSSVYPLEVSGQIRATFNVARRHTRAWTERDRAVLRALGRSLGLALERAEQTRALEEERAALDAFARFTEASTEVTDVLVLAGQARDVLRATLGDVSVGYHELDGTLGAGLWKARMLSEAIPPAAVQTMIQGIPGDLPSYVRPFEERRVVFVDGWDAGQEGIEHTEMYGAGAFYPYFERGEPRRLFTMGTAHARAWTERERSVFQSVGRSLELAFERLEQTSRLAEQNAELDARTRALEAFAELARDLTLYADPYTLMRRAQQVALSLLPDGYALYFEPDGDRWVLRAQTGDLRSAALQAAADLGLPYHETDNLLTPFNTLAPYYQDQYAEDTDNLNELVGHLGASATLPVLVEGRPVGVFAVVLFGERRPWSRSDRAVLESVTRSLGLAIERNLSTRQLQQERAALEAFTAFTEAAGAQTDVLALSRMAFEVLRTRFSDTSTSVYHEVEGDHFYARSWSEDIDDQPELLAALQGGTPISAPLFAEAVQTGEAAFTAHWDPDVQQIAHTEAYGAAAVYPVQVGGELFAFLGLGLRRRRNWTDQDAAVLRAVGRSLTLALERAGVVAQLAQRSRELERSNAELEQFTYVASHDLQEPLRTVTSFSQLLASRYGHQLDDKGGLYLRLMVEGTERMAQLLQDLLAFARVTSSAQAPARVDSGQLVAQVVQDLSALSSRTGASVHIGDLPAVRGDLSQLRQLFQNLIGNALKFGAPDRPPVVRVTAVTEGESVRFSVADNGIGIAPEFFERIFTIFQRLHTRDRYEGNGIGLSITRKIVERHGGRLWLESTPDVGTTFSFTLPAAGGGA